MILDKPTYLSQIHRPLPDKESSVLAFFHLPLALYSNDGNHLIAFDLLV